jgi:hypothetical protein
MASTQRSPASKEVLTKRGIFKRSLANKPRQVRGLAFLAWLFQGLAQQRVRNDDLEAYWLSALSFGALFGSSEICALNDELNGVRRFGVAPDAEEDSVLVTRWRAGEFDREEVFVLCEEALSRFESAHQRFQMKRGAVALLVECASLSAVPIVFGTWTCVRQVACEHVKAEAYANGDRSRSILPVCRKFQLKSEWVQVRE